ncbi:hypothetical protein BOTCAL_0004g00070 [Botryotinia calthae]|uniref:VIT domain-containing protein n=1 Tax=Botryotinia calthae TaxID=38488 RepID=A0A4Y8DHB4_9HELO|nr:hypothetical protein BOTCAL_0004g00070 [Botryotinia calthae]
MRPSGAVLEPPRVLREDELFGCLIPGLKEKFLPLHETEILTTIISGTFKTVLKQSFLNSVSLKDGQRCAYRFPLYDGVSVVGFKCTIGSDCVYGRVKDKKQAEVIYDAMVAKGDTNGIIVQVLEGPNLFITRIGHVPFGERVHVEITYVGELRQDINCMHFRIPAWIAPHSGFDSLAEHPTTAESVTSSIDHITGEIKITVDIMLLEGQVIKGVESPWHVIAVSAGTISTASQEVPTMNRASVTLSNITTGLEKDFLLVIQSNDIGTPYALLETHPTIPNHQALLISLIPQCCPPISLLPSPSEIVFVANLSVSMRNDIPMLISALKVFVKSLPINIKFNILSLGNKSDILWPQSKDYNTETLQEAMQYIGTLDAGYGPRKLFEAIKATIESRLPEMPLEIILVTGEEMRNQEPLLPYFSEQVEKSQGNIRMFCLGIGNTVAHGLIKRISRVGSGFFRCMQSGERLDATVVHMLRGALSPHIGDAVLDFKYDEDEDFKSVDKITDKREVLQSENEELDTSSSAVPGSNDIHTDTFETFHPQIIQAPHRMPVLFANTRTTAYLLMCPRTTQRNPTSIALRHSSSDGPPIFEIPIQVLKEKSATIHQLAAREAILDIEDSRGWMYSQITSETQTLAEKETVRLGEAFQIMNKWCSFVAVRSSDKEFLKEKLFPPNLSDANLSAIIIPMTPPPKLGVAATLAALQNNRPDTDRRPMASPSRQAWMQSPPVRPRLQSITDNMQFRSLSRTPDTVTLPTIVSQPSPVSPKPQSSQENTKPRPSSGVKIVTLPIITPPVPVVYPLSNTMSALALIDLQSFDGSWNADSENLSSILRLEIPELKTSLVVDIDVWVTMLVVRFLEDSIPEENNVWCLVVEKARRYVRNNLDTDSDMTSLERMAAAAIRPT